MVSENATDDIWTSDFTASKVTYMSPSITKIVHFTSDEVMGMTYDQLLAPSSLKLGMRELERHLALDRQGLEGQSGSWTLELEELCKDSSTVWVEARTSFIRDAEGRPIGLFGITRDITERKRAEKVLIESEKRYRMLFENSRNPICIIRRDGKILDANRAALQLLGYTKEEAYGLRPDDIATTRERHKFQKQIEEFGYVRDFEMKIRRKDGAVLDCLLTYALRKDDSGNILGYEGSARDVTEYKRLQKNLHLYINEATKAQEHERQRLSRELHDEVLQDLLVLGLEVEKAVRGGRQTYEWRVGKLKDIQNEVKRLATEVSVMSHALRPSVLDELGLVVAVRTSLTNLEETAGIKAKIQVLGSERRLDPDLELGLFRIIQEALSNARKHSEAHSVEIRIEFCSQLVSVAISDDGKGFEAPRRLSDLAATGKLGLTGMDERANTFGGRLFLESKPNEGTVIRVEIPYQKSTLNSRAT